MSSLSEDQMTATKASDAAYVINGVPAIAQSLVLSRLASSPTLLPQNLAELISAVSLAARVSIRASALFVEAILESVKYTTLTGLGFTRRALISAVGSARALNYINNKMAWTSESGGDRATDTAFLQVLDKWTNVGVYMIHHSFTLAELFAMSGFYLTLSTFSAGFSAAEESVRLLDSIFGSTETSRALSSIITLVRSELAKDEGGFSIADRGVVASLAALTKTLTAFVCLQTATHKRTLREMRLRVVYDCTVVVEGQSEKQFLPPSSTFIPRNDPSRPTFGSELGQPEETPRLAHRHRSNTSESLTSVLTDVRSEMESFSTPRLRTNSVHSQQEIEQGLECLCGDAEIEQNENEELPQEVVQALEALDCNPAYNNGPFPISGSDGMDLEIETLEETTTTTTTILRTVSRRTSGEKSSWASSRRMYHNSSPSSSHPAGVAEESDEEDWIEVENSLLPARQTSNTESEDVESYLTSRDIPTMVTGERSVALVARQDTLDHPKAGAERLQSVLKTMTKRLTQRRRTVHRYETGRSDSPARSPARSGSFKVSSPTNRRGYDVSGQPLEGTIAGPSQGKSVIRSFRHAIKRVSSRDSVARDEPAHQPLSPAKKPPIRPFTSLNDPGVPMRASSGPDETDSALNEETSPPHEPRLRRAPSSKSIRSVVTTTTTNTSARQRPEPESINYPPGPLVANLQRFMRYSSAAYGQTFLRILGIGKGDFTFPHTQFHANNHAFAHHVGISVHDVLLSSYMDQPTVFSAVKISPVVNYVAVDHSISSIVLSCRGSLGLSDILVDLTCAYETISVEHGEAGRAYFVHTGMYLAATTLKHGRVFETICEALKQYPTYGLVLCGHSLGGGVAALLSILWASPASAFEDQVSLPANFKYGRQVQHPRIVTPFVTSLSSGLPPGRPIACYAYGPPCITSPDLSRYCQGLVISTINNNDIVPTLSLGLLQDLKSMAAAMSSESGTAEEIVGRVIGLWQRRFRDGPDAAANGHPSGGSHVEGGFGVTALAEIGQEARQVPLSVAEIRAGRSENRAAEPTYRDPSLSGSDLTEDDELDQWLWSLMKTMRAQSDSEKLYPPGTVFVVEGWTVFISDSSDAEGAASKRSHREGRRVILRHVEKVELRFSEPIFGRTMLLDHSPRSYEDICDDLAAAVLN